MSLDPKFEENRHKSLGELVEIQGDLLSWPNCTLEGLFWLGRTKSEWKRNQESYLPESREKDIISLLSESKFGLLYNMKPSLGLRPEGETHIDFLSPAGKTIDLKATEIGHLLVREVVSPYSSGKFSEILVLALVPIRLYDDVDLEQIISIDNLSHATLAGWIYDHEIVSKGIRVGPGGLTDYKGVTWKKKNYVLPDDQLWKMKDLGAVIGQEARIPKQRPLCEKLNTPYYDRIRAMSWPEYSADLVRRQRAELQGRKT